MPMEKTSKKLVYMACRHYTARSPRGQPGSDNSALFVAERAAEDHDDVDDLPDDETAAGDELQDAGPNLAGIDAVDAAEADQDEQGKQEGLASGAGADFLFHGDDGSCWDEPGACDPLKV